MHTNLGILNSRLPGLYNCINMNNNRLPFLRNRSTLTETRLSPSSTFTYGLINLAFLRRDILIQHRFVTVSKQKNE